VSAVLPRAASLGDLAWLAEPGTYIVQAGTAAEAARLRPRLARAARKVGTTAHTNFDAGRLLVEIRAAH
jgi:hypothetical protein